MPQKDRLFLLPEEQYSATTWYSCVFTGISREAKRCGMSLCVLEQAALEKLESGSIVVLLGSSFPFVSAALNQCLKRDLRPIVAGFEVANAGAEISFVTINRRHAMAGNIKALVACGATRIALFGVNSAIQTDMLRYKGWRDTVDFYRVGNPETDVFYSDQGLGAALDRFLPLCRGYDAVACANDYCAVLLLSRLREQGIRVPEDLMVTGFGNIRLCSYTSPALTTVALQLSEVGEQVVRISRSLVQNSSLLSCSAAINSQIIVRQSTKPAYKDPERKMIFSHTLQPSFEPTYEQEIQPVYMLESTLASMDATDRKILAGVLRNEPYARLSEDLYLSENTLRYRMNKLFAATHTADKRSLRQLLAAYIPCLTAEENGTA